MFDTISAVALAVAVLIFGWMFKKNKDDRKEWEDKVEKQLEQTHGKRVEAKKTEAEAQARVEEADSKVKDLEDEEVLPPTNLDDAVRRFRAWRTGRR